MHNRQPCTWAGGPKHVPSRPALCRMNVCLSTKAIYPHVIRCNPGTELADLADPLPEQGPADLSRRADRPGPGRQLAHLELRLDYAPDRCPADRPLVLNLKNGSEAALLELHWQIAAYRPGDSINLAERLYETPRYSGPGELLPGADWQTCLPLPTLRSGYRASTLEFRAERLQGSFSR
ncbi:hypothetical protein PSEUDO8BK_10620 [Pseudomonas sp. 8BK]|nr:hypothetical protein PSEUDO8BK_10620 [Pseudomonas sp. 8BK]